MFKKIVGLWFSSKWKNAKDVSQYIKTLVEWWATEFFTWYNPSYWSEKFWFEISPNGRFSEHEQITDIETLKMIVDEIHFYNLEIFINLNAWYYTDETFELIKKMVDEFDELWIDWIICWNISILEYLKEIDYKWKINISTIMAVYNKEAIKFLLENYKINKIILSRELTLKEIEQLVTSFPKTLFEVFWEGDFCRYNNWLCFAEHKYWSKDICTLVVNDLVIKKKIRVDFKELILNENFSNEQIIEKMNDNYRSIFQQIDDIFTEINLWFSDKIDLEKELIEIIVLSKNRTDLFFDSLQMINSEKNKNILIYLKALKYLNKKEFIKLQEEIELSIKTWMEYLMWKTKKIWWTAKLKAYELWNFYARWDNLNLYTYIFFSKFSNIETVKFPTRWRNYNEKIKIITDVIEKWEVDKNLVDRSISLERTHYDLTYLFWDKLWFRELLKNFKT